jgi:hypothetical protein
MQTKPASVCGSAGGASCAEGGEERIAKRSRSATARRRAADGSPPHLRPIPMPLVTSARICEENGHGREAYERPTARDSRVGERRCRRSLPSEPDLRLSPHSAQAVLKLCVSRRHAEIFARGDRAQLAAPAAYRFHAHHRGSQRGTIASKFGSHWLEAYAGADRPAQCRQRHAAHLSILASTRF